MAIEGRNYRISPIHIDEAKRIVDHPGKDVAELVAHIKLLAKLTVEIAEHCHSLDNALETIIRRAVLKPGHPDTPRNENESPSKQS